MKILIIEDSESVANFYSLAFDGHEVGVCEDGKEFLAVVEGFSPDLVITDIHLRGISGVDTIKRWGNKEVKVAIISADSPSSIGRQAQQLKSSGYNIVGALSKPVNSKDLKELIK